MALQFEPVGPGPNQNNWDRLGGLFPLQPSTSNFARVPQARVWRSAATSHTSTGNFQKVAFDSTRHDTGTATAQFDDANDQLVCRVPGLYAVFGNVYWDTNATGRRIGALLLNGSTQIAADEDTPNASSFPANHITDTYRFAVGDTLQLHGFQSSGGNLAYQVGTQNLFMGWTWLSP